MGLNGLNLSEFFFCGGGGGLFLLPLDPKMKSTQHYHKQKGSIVPELILMFPAFIPALMASLASEPLLDPAVARRCFSRCSRLP